MMRWLGSPPIKLRSVACQHPERRLSRIRSFPHCQGTVKLGRKENSFRIRVQQDLLRIKAVNSRQIFSRHRVGIVTALTYVCDRNPAMPDMARLVRQKVETVDEGRNNQFRRSVEQQRHAFSVLSTNREIVGLLLFNPSGAQWQRAALALLPGCGFPEVAMGHRATAVTGKL